MYSVINCLIPKPREFTGLGFCPLYQRPAQRRMYIAPFISQQNEDALPETGEKKFVWPT